jgi:hypothetical protein
MLRAIWWLAIPEVVTPGPPLSKLLDGLSRFLDKNLRVIVDYRTWENGAGFICQCIEEGDTPAGVSPSSSLALQLGDQDKQD